MTEQQNNTPAEVEAEPTPETPTKISTAAYERLAADMKKTEEEERKRGRELGRQWAESYADWAELRDLAKAQETLAEELQTETIDIFIEAYSRWGARETCQWVEKELGCTSEDLLDGFLEGAIEVHDAFLRRHYEPEENA